MKLQRLAELLARNKGVVLRCDSRQIGPGDIFVALRGSKSDGHDFIEQAITKGAKYVVCEDGGRSKRQKHQGSEFIVVEDSAKALAFLAHAGKGNPCSKMIDLAVTGTNGKTTVAYLVRSIVQTAGRKCGMISTVSYDTGVKQVDSTLTTPDAVSIAGMCAEMADSGVEYMITEASSHALEQDRLWGIRFKGAAFTNLTGDHLDYHRTEDAYLAAKAKLFESLLPDSFALLNRGSVVSGKLADRTEAKVLYYGIEDGSDIEAGIESMGSGGTVFELSYGGERERVETALVGRHNVSNHLAAAGLGLSAGFGLADVAAGLSALKNVPGRMEPVVCGQGFTVLIDYAHTDDALRNVLGTLRPLCKGKLTVVFGCGGDRDKSKRPRMARAAEELAGKVIVTSDNPRTEEAGGIIEDILRGFSSKDKVVVEADRARAIEIAIGGAGKDDIVLIAGKGHETYQIIGERKIHFSDKQVAAEVLAGR
ncbi:MAG: UDP-N-acetylmuramoyl-L-alanyl-D-glutamate--2,6-diaminopimelate ligase [Planctomycetota bacterium]